MFNELDELDKLLYTASELKCKNCMSYSNCTQDIHGIHSIITHSELFNTYSLTNTPCGKKHGTANTRHIKLDKYKTVECDNKKILLDQLIKYNTLYIHGSPGLGKTHFLYYLANGYNKKGKSIYIDLFQNVINELKQRISLSKELGRNYLGKSSQSLITRLQNVDVLLIDDLGNERATEYTLLEVLQSIIDYRYLHNKTTIISSNHSTTKLHSIYRSTNGVLTTQIAPIISRLKDFGEFEYKSKYWRK